MRPRTGKQFTAVFQTSGLWGDVRYISPLVAYKQYFPMHYLVPAPYGHNVLAVRAQLGYVAGLGRRCGSAQQPLLLRRRRRSARLRYPRRHALRLCALAHQLPAHQSRRHLRPARSHQSRGQPVHPGAAAGLRHCLHRRRHQPDHQPGVPHPGCRTLHFLDLRRLRHRRGQQPQPVEAEPRRLRLAASRRFTAARFSTTAPAKAASPAPMLASSAISSPWPVPTSSPACPPARSWAPSCPSSTPPSASTTPTIRSASTSGRTATSPAPVITS